MKRILTNTVAFGLAAGAAHAGGIERSHSPYAILWESGNYAELSFAYVKPKVSGTVGGGAVSSGDMAGDYSQIGLGVKYAINDQLDLAVVIDQPMGADIAYSAPVGGLYPLAGSTGNIDSVAVTALARYKFDGGFSVHGGIKAQRSNGDVSLPFVGAGYTMQTSKETDLGYIIGAAYEKPEIALRVALTYQSSITHNFTSVETGLGGLSGTGSFETEVPQALTLDFQSGVAADTLVFGSIRWREWTAFDISPPGYGNPLAVGEALVEYNDDVVTYTLGVGRRFNENWAGAISIGYEGSGSSTVGNLGPHDGMRSITLGGTYTQDNMKITAGVSYIDIGDAVTNTINGVFTDNSGVGFGMKVGYSF
ncbi:hypothetical protein Q9295_03675 [Xinfangfangia sp. CPCC 101601]|uniref:Transporter n=1 Tax=Pseudogemmobacter lacusdianii TaxID=3069608 RepID=A0ABU0VUQ3_9RHOB|nr:hypothetical protein [Xinfangfangia sp. CPCC 101601]MDQ2065461.1 hypothetical protein [Xinfangfangia sp. CPCC 101601]